jgi:hypothetical protein
MYGYRDIDIKKRINLRDQPSSLAIDVALSRKIGDQLDAIMSVEEQNMLVANAKQRPTAKFTPYLTDALVLARDKRNLSKKKTKQKFHPVPLVVLHDYGHAALVQNHLGQTEVIHKDNLRKCPERSYEQFNHLPLQIKQGLGFPFDSQNIAEQIKQGTLNTVPWDPDLNSPREIYGEQMVTRRRQTELDKDELAPVNNDSDSSDDDYDSSSGEEEDEGGNTYRPSRPSKVTFERYDTPQKN